MVKKAWALLGASCIALAAACQLVANIERADKTSIGEPTDDGGGDAAPVNPDPCAHAKRPERPAQDDPTRGTPAPIIYLAIQTTKLRATDTTGAAAGFDLDGTCTCETRPFTAEGGAPSCKAAQKICDDDGGIDNAATHLFDTFGANGVDFDDAAGLNKAIAQGERGLIIALTDYNGEANDLSVQVGLFLSYGITDPTGCSNEASDTKPGNYKPAHCGLDKWTYDSTQVIKGPNDILVPVLAGRGWVTNHQLVFEGQVTFKVFLGDAVLSLGQPTQVGTLSKIDKNGQSFWQLDGILAGRLPTSDLLGATATFGIPNGQGKRFCDVPLLFGNIRDQVCASADIASGTEFDFKGGSCDAISTAIGFVAEQSGIGAPVTVPPPTPGCQDGGLDASSYSCN